jgi:hypothetical protein
MVLSHVKRLANTSPHAAHEFATKKRKTNLMHFFEKSLADVYASNTTTVCVLNEDSDFDFSMLRLPQACVIGCVRECA